MNCSTGRWPGVVAAQTLSSVQQLLMFWVLVQNALGVEKVVYAGENFLYDPSGADGIIDAATLACKDADACILFTGTSTINPHVINTASRRPLFFDAREFMSCRE